jgi:phage/plasmid primase-like uncharacterized protein
MSIFEQGQKCSKPRDRRVDDARTVRIEDEVARRGIALRGCGNERCGPCPVCGGNDRFSINVKKRLWNCWGCAAGRDVIELVRHLDGLSFEETVRLLTSDVPPQKPAAGARYDTPGQKDSSVIPEAPDNSARAAERMEARE